ncbi:hypothetical protein [Spiroplasma endosymbiont of Eupeodes luniger]|uniref:hypothetical protein n=1 Tax=Spiroplasma endosymbiont of Eupeodes luniger TaxID=3066300 RepID=UPI0030CED202
MSWLVIVFIGLVPLGAFFDTKKPPKPNMEQFFMKREKRATNPSQCGEICELKFQEISNSYLTIIRNFGSVTGIDISDVKNQLPSDIVVPNSDFEDFEYGFKYYDYNDFSSRIKVRDFYKSNATRVVKDSFPIVSYYEKYFIDKLVDVKITFSNQNYYQNWVITSFSAKVYVAPPPPVIQVPEKDDEQLLPTAITKSDGEYQYNQFQDKLDYLMIQRRDFDKFNYSYLYWVPIFNFFDDNFKYMSEISIKLNGFKQNSKFNLSRKNSYPPGFIEKVIFRELSFSSFGDVITIKTEHGSIVGYNEFLENGKSLWRSGSETSFGGNFINTFFGQVNYYGNTFHFLRYDDKLKTDFKDFMLHYQEDLTIDFINDLFNKIYKVLGGFFTQFFYASFDMDASTYVELDYKGMQQIPKNVLQMGFFYRSLITFYPKQYLINFGSTIENSKNMIFRSYFFVKDKQTANGFNTGKSSYKIDFNVLKAYDNQLWNATSNKLHFYNAKVDVMYGINIFTLTFPLYKKKNESTEYHYSLYDFNILNSTAFIGGGISGDMNDLIPTPNCSYWGLFSAISCGIQHASVGVLNWLLGLSGINLLIRPIADIAKTTINFTKTAFPVFEVVPTFQMLFEFVVPLAILLMILKKFS